MCGEETVGHGSGCSLALTDRRATVLLEVALPCARAHTNRDPAKLTVPNTAHSDVMM